MRKSRLTEVEVMHKNQAPSKWLIWRVLQVQKSYSKEKSSTCYAQTWEKTECVWGKETVWVFWNHREEGEAWAWRGSQRVDPRTGALSESIDAGETLKGFRQDEWSDAGFTLGGAGRVEGWEEEMSHRRVDLASAVCKELPVLFCF